jgi:hypothetical protein
MEDVLKMVAETTPEKVEDTPKPAVKAEDPPKEDPPKVEEPVAAKAPDIVVYLQGELTKVQASLVQALADKAILEAQTTEIKASHEGLVAIARDSIGRMSVALGGQATAGAVLSATEVLAEHARLSGVFKEKFKVGGVAAVSPAPEAKPKAAPVSPLFVALATNASVK